MDWGRIAERRVGKNPCTGLLSPSLRPSLPLLHGLYPLPRLFLLCDPTTTAGAWGGRDDRLD